MSNNKNYLFTSESVSEGHPDKICDQLSDAVLDAVLAVNPKARVACETLIKTVGTNADQRTHIIIAGEIGGYDIRRLDYETLTHKVIRDSGYGNSNFGLNRDALKIHYWVDKQSGDINQGVDREKQEEQGAGDQGLMFGYACGESDILGKNILMPVPIELAHRLMRRHAEVRKSGEVKWLGPDAKSQVTLEYCDGKPHRIDTVVLSSQHTADIQLNEIHEYVLERIIRPALPAQWLTPATRYLINPTGSFIVGGPESDCGLTGRKIIADTYGGFARHGGGAFSGKDPSKVDRSGAYAARYVAKNIVAAGLADRCEVQLSYAIGKPDPTSIYIDTFGTGTVANEKLIRAVKEVFEGLTPSNIIKMLGLERPIYLPTATYGHFGRDGFPWETCDKKEALTEAAKI